MRAEFQHVLWHKKTRSLWAIVRCDHRISRFDKCFPCRVVSVYPWSLLLFLNNKRHYWAELKLLTSRCTAWSLSWSKFPFLLRLTSSNAVNIHTSHMIRNTEITNITLGFLLSFVRSLFTWRLKRITIIIFIRCGQTYLADAIASGQSVLTKSRIAGRTFGGNNVMWLRPVGSIAVGCSIRAIMPLLKTGWFLLLPPPQQRLPMLFSGSDNPQVAPSRA